jgi:EXLDI family protein
MPNKTIYVADADLSVFERAQDLAGENLSSTIARALRRFIEAEEARQMGFAEITVKTGDKGTYTNKQFIGRELARRRHREPDTRRIVTQTVFQTAKGRLVLYVKSSPDWSDWRSYVGGDWDVDVDVDVDSAGQSRSRRRHRDDAASRGWGGWGNWSSWSEGSEYQLEVFESPDALKPRIPDELYNAVVQTLSGEEVEFLDI